MKAILFEQYGPPQVLTMKEINKPVPKHNEILIKVHATSVTSAEGMMRRGDTLMARLILGFFKPRKKYRILGIELAGKVESIGKDVTRFQVGDDVFGFTGFSPGAYAEYKCMKENSSMLAMPENVSYQEATSMVDGASTAICFLHEKAKIEKDQKVLIVGASGSIGTYAVQIAKYLGAHVTGICSGKNIDLVKSLGANETIDYKTEDFTQNGKTYDIIFDTVGKESFSRCKKSLTPKGKYLVTTGNPLKIYTQMLWSYIQNGNRLIYTMSVDKKDSLVLIKKLVESNKLKPVIDKIYSMDQIVDAHEYMETGHKRGNVIVVIHEK